MRRSVLAPARKPSQGAGTSDPAAKVIRMPCLYTKQVSKKRKAWSDGILRVTILNGVHICTVADAEDARGMGLESRQLEPVEVSKFRNREAFTLMMDNYWVEVTFDSGPPQQGDTAGTLRLKKFTPPSRIVVAAPPETISSHTHTHTHDYPSAGPKAHISLDDELDDLWGVGQSDMRSTSGRNDATSRVNSSDHLPPPVLGHTISAPPPLRTAMPSNKPSSAIIRAVVAPPSALKVVSSSRKHADDGFCQWDGDDVFSSTDLGTAVLAGSAFDEIDDSIWL